MVRFDSHVRSISIHAPRVGSDPPGLWTRTRHNDFNPRSPCGERQASRLHQRGPHGFQSTLPVWGATSQNRVFVTDDTFQSTLPVWGATRRSQGVRLRLDISIHAPRVGSDSAPAATYEVIMISIHAPRVGSDLQTAFEQDTVVEFQSTLPVWGATNIL